VHRGSLSAFHHPTDVVGGWLIGLAMVATVAAITAQLDRDPHGARADG
jgi:membrane-associated phospholipid phosphatase